MGQVAAIQTAVEQGAEYAVLLHTIAACRGAMDSLMAEVIEGHVRFHVLGPVGKATREQVRAAGNLVRALRAYLK